jgi:3',5'-nucleoside bisphosphate phosphatase
MKICRADLHIHTLLSPCGDLEMSPMNIIRKAREMQLDIIGITDHNSTLQLPLMVDLARENGLFLLMGAEVTTREEVHCLAFFETLEEIREFQNYLDRHLIKIKNDPHRFGYQVVVDRQEQIVYEEESLLIASLDQGLEQLEKKIHELKGLFIPAHVNRERYSLTSQLGFIPADIHADALEISRHVSREKFLELNPHLKDFTIIRSSDSHTPERIGEIFTEFVIERSDFKEIKMALRSEGGRKALS